MQHPKTGRKFSVAANAYVGDAAPSAAPAAAPSDAPSAVALVPALASVSVESMPTASAHNLSTPRVDTRVSAPLDNARAALAAQLEACAAQLAASPPPPPPRLVEAVHKCADALAAVERTARALSE